MKKTWIMIRKDWAEVFKNRFVLGTVAFLPLFLAALPLIIMGTTASLGGMGDLSDADLFGNTAELCEGLTREECGQYFIVNQFLLLFMILPLSILIIMIRTS